MPQTSGLPACGPGDIRAGDGAAGAPQVPPESMAEAASSRLVSWRALGSAAFAAYFAGSLVSNLGTWLQNTAQMLLAYQLTHSALAVGVVSCAQFSGFLLFGPWAGTIADRLGPMRVLIGAQLVSGFVAADMAYHRLAGGLTEHDLVLGALVIGFAYALALPVQTALIPALVGQPATKQRVQGAMAMNSVSYNAGRALAPVLAVVVLASIGAAWAFALNAITFFLFAATLLAISGRVADRLAEGDRPAWNIVRPARLHPRMLLLMAMVAAVTLADDPVLVLGPAMAHQVLHVSRAWPAFFLAALGLGTILGSLFPTRPPTSRGAALPLLVLAGSMIVFVLGISVWTSWIAAVCAGIGALLTGSSVQAEVAAMTHGRETPQLMALWALAWAGAKPIASLADGWLAVHHGVLIAGIVLATPAAVIAILERWLPGKLRDRTKEASRRYRRRQEAAAQAAAD